jgi:RecA-family ATPase
METANTITLPLEPTETGQDEQTAADIFKKHGLFDPQEVDQMCSQQTGSGGLVEGLLNCRSVSVLIGDSGLGKSPLAYQLGLCVATGIPFLGLKTQRGTVVYADYENGKEESRDLRNQLIKFLGLGSAPNNFRLWTPDSGQQLNIEGVCRDVKPSLFIIDSLRAHNPAFEKSENAGQEMAAVCIHGVQTWCGHHDGSSYSQASPDGTPARQ